MAMNIIRGRIICVGRRGSASLSSTLYANNNNISPSRLLSKPFRFPHFSNVYIHIGKLSYEGEVEESAKGFTRSTVLARAISEVTAEPKVPNKEDEGQSFENWKVKMLYDGECPLCMREVNMLMERDKHFRAIKFVDISSDKYNADENRGLDYETAMGRIHAILSDGTVVTDVEAFRKLYEAVGLGWVYAITKYEPIATIAGSVYSFWAKYRLPVTGRPPLEQVLEARKNKGQLCNSDKECKI